MELSYEVNVWEVIAIVFGILGYFYRRSLYGGWKAIVKVDGKEVFEEELSIEDAKKILENRRNSVAKTCECAQVLQSVLTRTGRRTKKAVYTISQAKRSTRTVYIEMDLDTPATT